MKQRAYQIRQIIKLLLPSSPYGKKQLKVSSVLMPSFGCTKSLPSMIICHHLTSFCLAEGQRQSFQAVIPVYNHRILSKIITEKPISGNKQSSQVSTRGNKPLKHIWELGKVFNLPKPSREPRTCIVEIKGKLYQRTRGYLRPRVIQTPHTTSR